MARVKHEKVGIVGVGNVGAAAAFALFVRRTAGEIVLVDKSAHLAEGQAMDLMHGQALVGPVTVRAGGYADLAGAQVVVVAAGAAQRPGEGRRELLPRNAALMSAIAHELDQHAPAAVVIVASNPVDLLTDLLRKCSDRPAGRVFGTGTLLDTVRFRAALGEHYGVDPRSVHAYIVGEHGESEVPLWSSATIGGVALEQLTLVKPFEPPGRQRLFESVRDAAASLIALKGSTSTAIGLVIARLVRAVLEDERSVLPVSVPMRGEYGIESVCLSIPCVVGRHGVEARVVPVVSPAEEEALRSSARELGERLREWERSR